MGETRMPPNTPLSPLGDRVVVAADPLAVAVWAAGWLAEISATAIADHGEFRVALSGGSTPRLLYDLLATRYVDALDWPSWRIFFGDERACPPTSDTSNFHLAETVLLSRVPVPEDQIHRIEAEREDLDRAATEYAQQLSRQLPATSDGAPRLDCVLLGLGEDGHTASLFPGTPALDVTDTWATRGLAPTAPETRVSITFPVINAATAVAFLVCGAGKGEALREVIGGTVPAARVRPTAGALLWFLDEAAADSALDIVATAGM